MIVNELHERTTGGSVWIGLERKVESKQYDNTKYQCDGQSRLFLSYDVMVSLV